MKRITLVLFLALITNFESESEVLDPDEALARVMNTQIAPRLKSSAKAVSPRLKKTCAVGNEPAVYVFDCGNDAGFLVVSADDDATPLLGYSDSGDVTDAALPASVQYWLNTYTEQIGRLRQLSQSQELLGTNKVATSRTEIAPLCSTAWGQVAPFNKYCPDGTVTGCVATAYAQILKTFNYPQHGNGTYSYTWKGQELSFDYENETFDWDNMLNSYAKDYTDEQADAVAKLMYACGVACDMNYGASSATAVTAPVKNYERLGLSSQISFVERDYYTQEEWEQLMYDALKVGPIMYAGQSADEGHEFVCDGYRDGYFHINWGWSGVFNGYFKLSALNAESQSDAVTSSGYNSDQNAIIFMQPAANVRSNADPYYLVTCSNFTIKQSSVALGKLATVTSAIFMKTTVPVTCTLDLKICDLMGKQVAYVTGPSINDAEFGGGYAYSVRMPQDLADGVYIVTPGYTVEGDDPRDVLCNLAEVTSYTMVVADGVCTFTANSTPSIDVTDFSLNTPIYENELFNVTAEISNGTSREYNGFVAVALVSSETNEVISVGNYVPLTVPVDGLVYFDYGEKFTSISESDSYEIMLIDKQGNQLSRCLPVTVNEGTPTFALNSDNLTVANADNVDKNDILINADVTCTEGYFSGVLTAYVFPKMGGFSLASVASGNVYINEGETVNVTFRGQISKLEEGVTYMVQISQGSNVFLKKENGRMSYTRFTVGDGKIKEIDDVPADDTTGVAEIDGYSNVVRTEYYTLQGVRVGAEVPAPGLYVKVVTLSNGEHRSQQVAVRR